MSDHFSGWTGGYHRKQPWSRHWFNQNAVTGKPFTFSSYYCFSNHFAINSGEGHLHYHCLHHNHQPDNSFAKLPPLTTNLHTRTWGRGGAKAYFRFHGGIGDGCCGIACRGTKLNTAARPLQLFDALDPIDFQNHMIRMTADDGIVKIPVIGPSVLPAEASGGTGVFLPVYPKKGMHVRGDDCRVGRTKQEDTFSKRFVGGDVAEKKEHKYIQDIPLELLLPNEWTY